MQNTITVKKLKEILANYADDTILVVDGGTTLSGDWAEFGVGVERKLKEGYDIIEVLLANYL